MIVRRLSVITAIAAAALLMSGCDGTPEPAKTTQLFSSEEEAFAAAEETYRAYVDALNAEAAGVVEADATDFLVGGALEAELASRRQLEADGERAAGVFRIEAFKAADFSPARVLVEVCLDVSDTRILDANGADITPKTRPSLVGLAVELVPVGVELGIESISGVAGEGPC